MTRQTFRSYFGFRTPKHRRNHGSRSLKIVVGLAVVVVIGGVILTLMHHSTSALPGSTSALPGSNTTTTQAPRHTTTTRTTTRTKTPKSTTSTVTKTGHSTTTVPTTVSTTSPSIAPAQVLVQVFNGSGVSGQAGATASALSTIGFRINGIADAATFTYSASVIAYAPGQLAAAQTLQHYIGGTTTLEQSSSVSSTEVQLITGTDFTGVTNS
ncbi:MAG TPA: LytR C-terminal domain-containing protein [Acidimicrobiales bacterium]|nr:LytR C-terminal domain-containing protein [Acidimicrobiales bacterium]